jgi:heat shock protein HslJ
MVRIVFVGACLSLSLVACGDSSSTDDVVTFDDVVALTFTSTSVQEDGAQKPLASEAPITLSFTEDGISLNAGCNTLFGEATIESGRLTLVSALASSLMMCDDTLMRQDEWLTAFISASPQITKADDTITLTSDDSTIQFQILETVGIYDTPIYGPEELPNVQAMCDRLVANGATVEEGRAAAEDQGYIIRIVGQDGESRAAILDANPGRLNLDVVNGIITSCSAG